MQREESNNNSVFNMCVCAWIFFCFAGSMACPTMFNAGIFHAFEKMLSHDNRKVKFATAFS